MEIHAKFSASTSGWKRQQYTAGCISRIATSVFYERKFGDLMGTTVVTRTGKTIMSVVRKIEVAEPLIERLFGEVNSEIHRRSDLTNKAANIADPFISPNRRNTSRGAAVAMIVTMTTKAPVISA
ncbi:MAG: hypothetical protein ACR2QS_07885 [Woeseiaceae bacterium]